MELSERVKMLEKQRCRACCVNPCERNMLQIKNGSLCMPPFLFFLAGVAAGAGAALLTPTLAPEASRNLRPVLRAGVKLAVSAGMALRSAEAEAMESVEDLYAEAEAELAEEAAPPAPPPAPATRGPARRPRKARQTKSAAVAEDA
jgi:hypothetical protein